MTAPQKCRRRAHRWDYSAEHLEEAVEALEIDPTEADTECFEELYGPVRVTGHDRILKLTSTRL